jgi:hypothetical protein
MTGNARILFAVVFCCCVLTNCTQRAETSNAATSPMWALQVVALAPTAGADADLWLLLHNRSSTASRLVCTRGWSFHLGIEESIRPGGIGRCEDAENYLLVPPGAVVTTRVAPTSSTSELVQKMQGMSLMFVERRIGTVAQEATHASWKGTYSDAQTEGTRLLKLDQSTPQGAQ